MNVKQYIYIYLHKPLKKFEVVIYNEKADRPFYAGLVSDLVICELKLYIIFATITKSVICTLSEGDVLLYFNVKYKLCNSLLYNKSHSRSTLSIRSSYSVPIAVTDP